MIHRIRRRIAAERGFTIVELLVVMIVIGILAAIALAVFVGQRTKANDAGAKDAAATLNVDIASCNVDKQDYSQCATAAQIGDNAVAIDTGITALGDCSEDPGPTDSYPDPQSGEVAVVAAAADCYVITAVSRDGHMFFELKRPGLPTQRSCAPAGQGGCSADATWNRD